MPGLADYRKSSKIKALIFGGYKTGKTAGAGTFPRTNFIDCDKGIATLTNPELEKKYGYMQKVVSYGQFIETEKTARGVPTRHLAFDAACKYFDEWNQKDKRDLYDTWVIDSGTTLGEFARNKAIILLGGTEFSTKPLSHTHKAAMNTGMIVPKLQDFGAERSLLEQFVDMVLDTDKNVLLLSHERDEWEGEPPNERKVAITPMFTGQSAQRIPLKFDEVWNLRIEKEGTGWKRYLQTVPDGLRQCGSRLGLPTGTPFEYEAIKKALNL